MKIESAHYLLIPLFSILIFIFKPRTIMELCDLETCPYCYGKTMCTSVEKNWITLQYDSVTDFIYNFVSVKNVFFARFKNKKVVLKKLGSDSELEQLEPSIDKISVEFIKSLLLEQSHHHPTFHICDDETFDIFVMNLKNFDFEQIYTILKVNAEPFLLQIFSSEEYYPVPHFYGSCGRLVIEENCGEPLNIIDKYSWYDRAYVSYQILQAAHNFTGSHSLFRLYLTDISPDNIVVSEDLKVSFVDLEHGVLKLKTSDTSTPMLKHRTEHLENTYYYSQSSLCGNHVSDHNIYGVCMLLLSELSPWPMMQGGLLHDPPKLVKDKHKSLFDNIEFCVDSESKMDRFELSYNILRELKVVLNENNSNS